MKTVTSISGGRTSAYLAANYPTDYNVFALVRIEDENCRFKDEKIRRLVEDKIQAPFIATAEYDDIIYTILDLEQFLGKEIKWVTGKTYDEVINTEGGWLPNHLHRYCTTKMKLEPIFNWWHQNFIDPVIMNIGFRFGEGRRANKMRKRLNADGLLEYKHGVMQANGRKKWSSIAWQKPNFPLIVNRVKSDTIQNYWRDKPVGFAKYNNCVGCFHREPLFLRYMYQEQPDKMAWFEKQEQGRDRGTFKYGIRYEQIKNLMRSQTLFDDDFSSCDAGYCGM